jgi:adenylate cyclase
MAFRIGITIGDVVERDGDLLGDGVNIAARLEGLAEVGGICVSRAVHEQVVNKLSVQFADIGAQEVKNIPTPVHAYMVAMRREDGSYAQPQVKKPPAKPGAAGAPGWLWPVVIGVVAIVAICVGGFLYFTKLELTPVTKEVASTKADAQPPATTSSPSPTPTQSAQTPSPGAASIAAGDKFVPEVVPFVSDRVRLNLASEYASGADYKAFALNPLGIPGMVVGQPSEEAARTAALELCQKRADNFQPPRKCELYAVGNAVVYPHGRPPVPPTPWIRHDPTTERPFVAKEVPMVRDAGRSRIENVYPGARKSKSMAIGPGGQWFFDVAQESVEESARRTLENCGATVGVPCMIVAADDAFVVPVPTLMRAVGFFKAAANSSIAAVEREQVARKLADARGWTAVAVGATGRPGLGLNAASEQNAINDALGNCAKLDADCHVIAIGPFVVGSNN